MVISLKTARLSRFREGKSTTPPTEGESMLQVLDIVLNAPNCVLMHEVKWHYAVENSLWSKLGWS